jgi:glycosyltransferase involved in cell wall biosynthesis
MLAEGNPLRVAIVTTGRFHVLDLARELAALGHDVAFYSHVPRGRAEQFGLPRQCHRGLLPWVLPLIAAQRRGPKAWNNYLDTLLQRAVDGLATRFLEPCDMFIGMSGLCVKSAQVAREKYDAKIILERGSRHILSQKEILEAIPGLPHPAVPEFNVRRELWGYQFADVISIPSRHVERSFLERGFPNEKLFRNPYGVDLTMFPPTAKPQNQVPTLVFAGTWSLQKGCDVLAEALRGQPWRLIHVGAVADAALPNLANFESRGFVPQSKLAEVYAQADIFVQASRQEGLSVVQAQALSSGLPLVCTDRTGGEDLAEFLDDPTWVTLVKPDDVSGLRAGIEQALTKAGTQTGLRDILGGARERFSWRAYAKRYEVELRRRLGGAL